MNDTTGLNGEKSFIPGICFSIGAENKKNRFRPHLIFHKENDVYRELCNLVCKLIFSGDNLKFYP